MEPGCKYRGFGRGIQPAAPNCSIYQYSTGPRGDIGSLCTANFYFSRVDVESGGVWLELVGVFVSRTSNCVMGLEFYEAIEFVHQIGFRMFGM